MQQTHQVAEKMVFLYKFLQSPKSVGSVTPSSRFLTEKMMQPIDWHSLRAVAELGAGTGVFTRAIRERMHPDATALIFEQDHAMRRQLHLREPRLTFETDARDLSASMARHGINCLDAVVSGLPFANFDPMLRDRILDEVSRSLRPGGVFVTFQYSLQMKAHLEQRFDRVEIGFVPLNFPPAFVYVCRTGEVSH